VSKNHCRKIQAAGATGKRTVTMTENENSLEHRALAMTGNKNALKHGAFAEAILLPQEDPKEFDELLASLYDEWNPEGATEIDKVNSIAMGLWRKRRFKRYIQNLVATVDGVDRYRKRNFYMLLDVLEEIEQAIDTGELGAISEGYLSEKLHGLAGYIKKAFPRKNYGTDTAWLSAISVGLTDLVQARLDRVRQERTISQEMSDEVFADREQAFEERIDSKIDKDIKALGQIKTMKAIGIGRRRAPVGIDPPKVGIDPPRLTGAPPILIGKREEDNPE
jgi:hypothetical protein